MLMDFNPLISEGITILQKNLLISPFQCTSHIFSPYLIEIKIKKFVKQICLILIHKFNHK